MTTERSAGEVFVGDLQGAEPPVALPVAVILSLCDRLLNEAGRRRHLFAWLRPPGSGAEDWLAVDAYYPSSRLVVVCHEQPTAHDHLYAGLVPGHGMRLLQCSPADLGCDRVAAESALNGLIAALPPAPPRAREPPLQDERAPGDGAIARVAASLAQATAPAGNERPRVGPDRAAAAERAARFGASRVNRRALAPRRRAAVIARRRGPVTVRRRGPVIARSQAAHRRDPGPAAKTVGLVVGLALAAVLCAELYLGVGLVALNGGHWLLAFGIALDACSRALGTIAAGRAGARDWGWGCVIGGSPAVALFALFQPEGPVATEPAPLAGLLSVLAVLVIGLAVLGAAPHI